MGKILLTYFYSKFNNFSDKFHKSWLLYLYKKEMYMEKIKKHKKKILVIFLILIVLACAGFGGYKYYEHYQDTRFENSTYFTYTK